MTISTTTQNKKTPIHASKYYTIQINPQITTTEESSNSKARANSPSIQQPIKTHTNCNNDNKKHKRHRTPRKKTTTYSLVCDTAPIQQRTMPSALPHSGTQQHHITCGAWCVYVYRKEKTQQIANNTSHYTKATKQSCMNNNKNEQKTNNNK